MPEPTPGATLARLLLAGFEAMVDEVMAELARRGHEGASAALELALEAVDDGADTASALGRRLGVSKQAAAKTIANLERMGYLERHTDPGNARRKPLAVTGRGRDMTAIGAACFDRIRQRWAEEIGEEQLTLLESHLAALAGTDPGRTRPPPPPGG